MAGRGRAIAAVILRRGAVALWRTRFGLRRGRAAREIRARQIRLGCEELGPTFIKLGQLASVRPDVFSPETVFELSRLRERVPPVPTRDVVAILTTELGAPPERVFETFDDVPYATASIAQVHLATLAAAYHPVVGATLPVGARLAVKVVRPGVERSITADLAVARRLVRALERVPFLSRWRPAALLREFEASLARELDLREEGRTADRFAHDLRDDPLVVVPPVVWRHTTRRVLTTAYVEGWRLDDLGEAERAGIDAQRLASHGAELFMRQVLELGRFHADLHPANLLVTPDGRIGYLDFGIVGYTTPPQRVAIAQVLAATVHGDAARALRYSRELGLDVPPERIDALQEGVHGLMQRHLVGRARADVRGFAAGFLALLADARVSIPEGYGLLIKALVTVEGVARAIDPDVDVLASARPYITRLVAAQLLRPERLRDRTPAALRAALRAWLA